MKLAYHLVSIIFITSLLSACAPQSKETDVAVAVALTQTAAAPAPTALSRPTAPAATGMISGKVGLMAPPTPHMTVYAVDQITGSWAFAETTATDAAAPFSLIVPPGSYRIFAFTDDNGFSAYSVDGQGLSVVTVAANQTISDIMVQFPGQGECGISFGAPASPDGRFKAVPGPSADCLAKLKTPEANSNSQQDGPEPTRIQFQPNSTSWYTPGDLVPHGNILYVLYALKGQTMTVNLTTEPASIRGLNGTLFIKGADGKEFTPNSTLNWSGVLPTSQDYFVGVASMSDQSINYTLSISIPPAASAPASADAPKIAKNQPIRFATGPLSVELKGSVLSGERDRYSLSIQAGETLEVLISALEGNAAFSILGPDQTPLPGTEEGKDTIQWSVPIRADGSYAILVGPTRGNASYTLKVNVTGLP